MRAAYENCGLVFSSYCPTGVSIGTKLEISAEPDTVSATSTTVAAADEAVELTRCSFCFFSLFALLVGVGTLEGCSDDWRDSGFTLPALAALEEALLGIKLDC